MAVVLPRSGDLLAPGQRIGPFLLLAPLGAGGAGRVWAVARTGQLGFSKRMVLKVMRQDKLHSERARQRFDREARLGAQLRHRYLRGVHEVGSHAGRPYMALSWVDTSLAELLELAPGKRLESRVACWIAIQICEGLAAAHGHLDHAQRPCPIVHGDVSPGNILLTTQGHVLLADLAGAAAPSASRTPESGGEEAAPAHFFGSLGYASPEALRGQPLDGRADLFSLGCVLYEMLCGAPAFEADDERSLLYQVLEQEPPELQRRAPDVDAELAAVVRRGLQRRLEERFQSAAEMSAALRACVSGQSAFRLEELSTALIQRVLGERLRAREEEMRGVFQRFSVSQFERTETLPIASASPGRATTTLRAGTLEPVSESAVTRSAGPAPRPRTGRWGFWAAGFVALSLLAGFVLSALRRPQLQAATSAASPASVDAPRPASEQTQQALHGAAALGSAALGAAGAAPLGASATAPSNPGAVPAEPSRPTPPAAVTRTESHPEAVPAHKRSGTRRASEPAAAASESAPETAAQRPFQWNFPDDPYEAKAPASKPAAEAR